MKFQAKVMVLPGAILKYDVCVCGGWVMVRPPAGADCGILRELVDACDDPLPDPGWAPEDELCWFWFCELLLVLDGGGAVADMMKSQRVKAVDCSEGDRDDGDGDGDADKQDHLSNVQKAPCHTKITSQSQLCHELCPSVSGLACHAWEIYGDPGPSPSFAESRCAAGSFSVQP